MNILGVSALYHDSAAALIHDGKIVAATQEERFTRIKHDASLPVHAIRYCLDCLHSEGGHLIGYKEQMLDYVVFYDDPFMTLSRCLHNIRFVADDAEDLMHVGLEKQLGERLWIRELLRQEIPELGTKVKFFCAKHHISHAASAFYPSPFDRAVILTLDGVGEWTTLSIGIGDGKRLTLKEEMRYPDSLGLFYSAFTYFCGFKVNSGDYKFMGLAPYGSPRFVDVIEKEIIEIFADGSFKLNLNYFDYQHGRTMINESRMAEIFGGGRRLPETQITQREMDIAASVQQITEKIILLIVQHAKEKYGNGIENLVLAGGVALNCVANGKVLRSGIFKHIWVQPAAGDAGGALGAALYLYHGLLGHERYVDGTRDSQQGSFLGPEFSEKTIWDFLQTHHFPFRKYDDEDMAEKIAELLEDSSVIGIFHGRMEFGPRALGHRSIIADPRSQDMQARLNLKIKFRESFRPFAPAVLAERVNEYFELDTQSPYMLICADVQSSRCLAFDKETLLKDSAYNMLHVIRIPRSDIPAVTHVDYSARIQTVDEESNPFFYKIIKAFEKRTDCGVIVNTSFNVRGEPIVCTPEDAYRCFMRTEMDALVMQNCLLLKEEQPCWKEEKDWRELYELD